MLAEGASDLVVLEALVLMYALVELFVLITMIDNLTSNDKSDLEEFVLRKCVLLLLLFAFGLYETFRQGYYREI